MAKVLTSYVSVHPENGPSVDYEPGDTVPAEHLKLITNPKAFAQADEASAPVPGSGQTPEPPGVAEAREAYEDMKVGALREEAERRGLSAEGKKDELIDRLVEDDAV